MSIGDVVAFGDRVGTVNTLKWSKKQGWVAEVGIDGGLTWVVQARRLRLKKNAPRGGTGKGSE